MMLRYPYIFIGVSVVVIPFLMMGAVLGGMVFLLESVDADELEFSYGYLNNATQNILMVYPSYTYIANEPDSLVDSEGAFMISHYSYLTTKANGLSDVGGSLYEIGIEYFTVVTDYYLEHNNTSIKMEDYDKIILMRNTYTTDNFRTMVLNHTNVVYMFPDALTKKIVTNSTYSMLPRDASIVMVYDGDIEPLHPMSHVWADDNRCVDWEFVKVVNGYMMNCTPDIALINNHEMIMAMRDIGEQPKVFKPIEKLSGLFCAGCSDTIIFGETILINNATNGDT